MKMKFTSTNVGRGWKDLLPEIHEKILAYLHFRDLCRSRVVCKEWNRLITQPSLLTLHANTPRQASSILISPFYLYIRLPLFRPHTYWEIYDMAEKNLYTFNDSPFVYPSSVIDKANCFFTQFTLATDGGLIYIMNDYATDYPFRRRHHSVLDLVTKDFHQIMELDVQLSYDHDIVVLLRDKATGSFRIIVIEALTSDMSRREGVFIYASSSKEWRWLCEVPGVNRTHRAISSIFVKGVFYTLFFDMSIVPWCPELYSCDLETGEWSYIDVELPRPSHPQETSQLVTSLGRLFLVEYTGLPNHLLDLYETPSVGQYFIHKKSIITITIWEILVKEKKVIKVAKLPKFSKYPGRMVRASSRSTPIYRPIAVLGCGNYIVILTIFGCHVRWDLMRNCWDELTANTVDFDMGNYYRGLFAGLVDF